MRSTNTVKTKLRLGLLASSVLLAAGCANIHTAEYKENRDANTEVFDVVVDNIDTLVQETRMSTQIDDFFVDLNTFTVAKDSSSEIPDYLPSTVSFFQATPFTESQLRRALYEDYGIYLDFVRLIQTEEESVDQEEIVIERAPSYRYDDAGSEDDALEVWLESSDPRAASLFGKHSGERDSDLLPPLTFNGPLVDFLEVLSAQIGLSWKFDEVQGAFVFYDLDTQVFRVIDNSAEYARELAVSTESEASSESGDDSGSMESSTRQRLEDRASGNHWEDLSLMVESMLSEHGKAAFDQKNGLITVTDSQSVLGKIETVIDARNEDSQMMVVLDVEYVKVTIDSESSLGTNFSYENMLSNSMSGVSGGYTGGASMDGFGNILTASFDKAGIEAMIGAMSSYGTVSTRKEIPVVTRNNSPRSYQAVIEERYISKVEKTNDENGDTSWSTETDYNKTGITSVFTPRVYKDNVLVEGAISLSANLDMVLHPESGITLPKNASEVHPIDVIIPNGQTRVVSIQREEVSTTSANGPLGEGSLLLGGSEATSSSQEVSLVVVTPYIIN